MATGENARVNGIPIRQLSPDARRAAIEELNGDAALGRSAADLLAALEPLMEKRLEALTSQLETLPPELPALLDWRAKFVEVNRIARELKGAKNRGAAALQILRQIVTAETSRPESGR